MPELPHRFIDQLVRQAGAPGAAGRDLRDELLAHFEDAAAAHGSLDAARRAFGPDAEISSAFRRVYAGARARWQAARLVTALFASAFAALAVEITVAQLNSNAPAFRWRFPDWRAAGVGLVVAIAAFAAREVARRPLRLGRVLVAVAAFATALTVMHEVFEPIARALDTGALVVALAVLCGMLRASVARSAARVIAFAALMYALHFGQPYAFGPGRAAAAGAILAAVWMATLAILARVDHAFRGPFGSAHAESLLR